jgi:hypothetical protein
VLLTLQAVEESSDPEADRAIDWVGIFLSALGLGGPVFALIQQPTHGWGDPLVYVPLIGGTLLFAAFLLWESRYRHAMLDLSLFRIRNFWVTNLETLIVYAGLIGAFFFLALFLQQTMGYTPLEAGLATTPTSVALFVLSPRFGRFATAVGPRLPMAVGPIVGGIGLLLLTRLDASSDYLTGVLPGVVLFGLGLSLTVAPLTATALNSVEERRMGIASGINNGVSRVAGLLAIAILGAVIAGSFESSVDDKLDPGTLSPEAVRAVEDAERKPLGAAETAGLRQDDASVVDEAITSASEDAFHLAMGLAGALMIVGGVIAGVGIVDPRRPLKSEPENVPRAAAAGECGRASEPGPPGPVPGTLAPDPAGAPMDSAL